MRVQQATWSSPLTNKLLKLVNSAHYQHFGNISTVSRAVVIMGFDNVRNVAITLMLFEHLQNKAQAAQLKDEILATYFSALVARELTPKAGVKVLFACSGGVGSSATVLDAAGSSIDTNSAMPTASVCTSSGPESRPT